jgi:hypothetical protein
MVGRRAGVRLGLSVGATMVGSSQTQASGKSTKDRRHPGFFKVLLRYVDKPFRVAGKLTFVAFILGAFGSLTGVYVQYTAWREEKNIARYNEDLKNSIATLSELSGTLSAIMNLQQILFYTFREALEKNLEADHNGFYFKNATKVYDEYLSTRTALRKNIDALVGKTKVFLDLPTDPERVLLKPIDLITNPLDISASNRSVLAHVNFDCKKHLPIQFVENVELRSEVETLTINWNNTKHHLNTFYYCLEDIHFNIIEIRTWASGAKLVEEDKDLIKSKMQSIEDDISILSFRFNALMAVAIRKVEEIRLRERPRPFLCHQTGLFCN